jgi:hypothetical protein
MPARLPNGSLTTRGLQQSLVFALDLNRSPPRLLVAIDQMVVWLPANCGPGASTGNLTVTLPLAVIDRQQQPGMPLR